MRENAENSAALGVIVGAILLVLLAVVFLGGFDFTGTGDGGEADVSVSIEAPQASAAGT